MSSFSHRGVVLGSSSWTNLATGLGVDVVSVGQTRDGDKQALTEMRGVLNTFLCDLDQTRRDTNHSFLITL